MSNSILDKIFPAAPPHDHVSPRGKAPGSTTDKNLTMHTGKKARDKISTRWASIYTLELRGFTHKQIAEALNMSQGGVSHIQADPRYIAYREEHLSALDQEFVAMKPLAFRALRGGLSSPDENTALRASEQWFKAANYGGFSKHERPAVTTSAEDIARELLRGGINVQVNTQVNVSPPESE